MATRGRGGARGDAATGDTGDVPEAEYYREIGGAELANLVRTSFDRVRWWQMPVSNPGGCSPAGGLSVDTYLLGVGRC